MNQLTTQELEAIRKRAEQATEGPWELTNTGIGVTGMPRKEVLWATISEDIYGNKADVEFVLSARTDIPKLLAEVDRLNAVLDEEISEKEHVIMAQQMEIGRLYSKLNGGD